MSGDGACIKRAQRLLYRGVLKCLMEQKTVKSSVILIQFMDLVFVFQLIWSESYMYQRGSKVMKKGFNMAGLCKLYSLILLW